MSVLSETPSVSHHHSFAAAHTYVSWSESRSRSVSFRIAHCYSEKGLLIIEKVKKGKHCQLDQIRSMNIDWVGKVRKLKQQAKEESSCQLTQFRKGQDYRWKDVVQRVP